MDTPRILGHEVVGTVVELGDRARARWGVGVGDRVAVESSVACGSCRSCVTGFSQTCSARLGYGSNVTIDVAPSLWGGLAELMYLAPGTVLTRLPDAVPADVAAGWLSPLANAVDWTGPIAGSVQPGDTVVILGPGAQGLASCLAARTRGAGQIILAGLTRDERRLAAGVELGATRVVRVDEEFIQDAVRDATNGALADVVIDVSGNRENAQITAHLLRQRGTVVAASPINVDEGIPLPLRDMIWKQIRWQGVLSNRPQSAGPAAALLAQHVDIFARLVTHRFPLAESDAAIDMVAGKVPAEDPIKVVVCP